MINSRQPRDSSEHQDQDSDDSGQGAARGFDTRLAKSLHAVADGFYARHGGASAGERLENDPEPSCATRGFERRRGNNRHGVPAAQGLLDQAQPDGAQQANDEEIGGHQEDVPGLAHAAQVDERDDEQDAKAKRERVWKQTGRR